MTCWYHIMEELVEVIYNWKYKVRLALRDLVHDILGV